MDLQADMSQLDKEFTDFKVNTSFKLSSLQNFIEKYMEKNRVQTEALEQELSKKAEREKKIKAELEEVGQEYLKNAEQLREYECRAKAQYIFNSNLRSQNQTLKDNAEHSKFQITMLTKDKAALTSMLEQANAKAEAAEAEILRLERRLCVTSMLEQTNAKAEAAEAEVLSLERRLCDAFEELSRLHTLALEREEK